MQRSISIAVLALVISLVAFSSIDSLAVGCSGFIQCCFEDFRHDISDCYKSWGPPISGAAETGEQASDRKLVLQTCLSGAKMALRACLEEGAKEPVNPSHTDSVTFLPNGEFVISTSEPSGNPPQSYAFNLEVPAGHGGGYQLVVLNGLPDEIGNPDFLQRVSGIVGINGVDVLNPSTLNATTHEIEIPVTLLEGSNTLTVEIAKEDDSWFGFAVVVLRNWEPL